MKTLKQKKIAKSLFGCFNENTGKIETEIGGRVFCKNCFSIKGLKVRNYYCKGRLRLSKKCVNCGSKEIKDNWNGDILRQEQNMTQFEQYKEKFYKYLEELKKFNYER